ncbi:hypothetical protein LEP1GSC060_0611 [Leptospira weilii serovar Ranarum str. ICFT]|uniref:Uncharacterized protein n=1 Tax=Leptospira weilii serovar Ranarum str. ICFT TaxID=1218598 RepID=N1WBS1_9LEPT|nr:hypothetical protein LEP1GSC060_0611 [Leptospira weilii serovar Ranarum str. ICFT]
MHVVSLRKKCISPNPFSNQKKSKIWIITPDFDRSENRHFYKNLDNEV